MYKITLVTVLRSGDMYALEWWNITLSNGLHTNEAIF